MSDETDKGMELEAALHTLNTAYRGAGTKALADEVLLNTDRVKNLIDSLTPGDYLKVKGKLDGRRGKLSPDQAAVVTLIKHLPAFEEFVGEEFQAVQSDDRLVSVEYMVQKRAVELPEVSELGFVELSVLRENCSFADALAAHYGGGTNPTSLAFGVSALNLAQQLVGRTLELPTDGLDTAAKKAAWTRFKNGQNSSYEPLEVIVVETEAFEQDGPVTRMRNCMVQGPGVVDIMPYRGLKYFNIGSAKVGEASCVMLTAVAIYGEVVEGPGRVGNAIHAESLTGKSLRKDYKVLGCTLPSGYHVGRGAANSLGGYRLQVRLPTRG